MAMEGKMNVVKYLVFFFNFLFWLSGLALIIVGAIVKDKYGDYLSFADKKYADAAVFLIVVGIIVFVIGFLGCCGAIKENYCMITTFAVLLTIIFILEIAAGALGFAYRKKVGDFTLKALEKGIDKYHTDEGAKQFYDWVQDELDCCGVHNYSDWKNGANATTANNIPQSCCEKHSKDKTCVNDKANLYTEGCKQKFEDFVKKNLVLIGGIGVGIAFLQILGIIFACCLMREIRGQYEVV